MKSRKHKQKKRYGGKKRANRDSEIRKLAKDEKACLDELVELDKIKKEVDELMKTAK